MISYSHRGPLLTSMPTSRNPLCELSCEDQLDPRYSISLQEVPRLIEEPKYPAYRDTANRDPHASDQLHQHDHATPVYSSSEDHVKICTTVEDTTSCRSHWSQEYSKIVKIPNR